jgi:hypothetical protein
MKQQEAIALIMYLQRAAGIVPTTGNEWTLIGGALKIIEGVANGQIEIDVKPKGAPDGTASEG